MSEIVSVLVVSAFLLLAVLLIGLPRLLRVMSVILSSLATALEVFSDTFVAEFKNEWNEMTVYYSERKKNKIVIRDVDLKVRSYEWAKK